MDFLKTPEVSINFDTPNRAEAIESLQRTVNDRTNAVLGRGAYGVVLRANYKRHNVAVKILEKANSIKYNSIKKESNIMNLHHENIIGILKIVDCKTHGAIIMERFEGNGLQYVLNHYQIDLIHRLHILSDIARALVCCHENNIVHLDVKPQNVFVAVKKAENTENRSYICKLIDFGSSMFGDSNEDGSYKQFGGTVRYSSPEVLLGDKPDFSADIFSLAVLMWQMKEDKLPYDSIQANDTIIWNVVKNDMRPDTLKTISNNLKSGNRNVLAQTSCKSESNFLQLTKLMKFPLTPKSCNRSIRKVPEILVSKQTAEKSLTGSLKKTRLTINKNQLIVRKKLFGSISSPSDKTAVISHDVDMQDLFLDEKKHKRSPERILWIESEYVKTYKDCWSRVKSQRYSAIQIQSIFERFINSL